MRIEDLSIGDLAYQNGDYSVVSESNVTMFYALIDEWEYEGDRLNTAYKVCDMDEDKFSHED